MSELNTVSISMTTPVFVLSICCLLFIFVKETKLKRFLSDFKDLYIKHNEEIETILKTMKSI